MLSALSVTTNAIAFLPPPTPGLGYILLAAMFPVFGLLLIFLYDYLSEEIRLRVIPLYVIAAKQLSLKLPLVERGSGKMLSVRSR